MGPEQRLRRIADEFTERFSILSDAEAGVEQAYREAFAGSDLTLGDVATLSDERIADQLSSLGVTGSEEGLNFAIGLLSAARMDAFVIGLQYGLRYRRSSP